MEIYTMRATIPTKASNERRIMGLPLWNPPRLKLRDCLVAVFDVSTIGSVVNAVVDAYEILISLLIVPRLISLLFSSPPRDLIRWEFDSSDISSAGFILCSCNICICVHTYIRIINSFNFRLIFYRILLSFILKNWFFQKDCGILIEENIFLSHLVIHLFICFQDLFHWKMFFNFFLKL